MGLLRSTAAAAGACVLLMLWLAACGDNSSESTATSGAVLPQGCEDVPAPPPKKVHLKAPEQKVSRSDDLTAKVETSCGSFSIDLDAKDSPRTVNSFVYLAKQGVYDDTAFHRIVPNFVIQGGDPKGNGTGGPGYSIDEPPPVGTEYTQGTVAMAKLQVEPPGRSGSQFFVVTAADAGLQPDYALLGKVSSGEDVVKRIAELGDPNAGDEGKPLAPVVIDTVKISQG